MSRAAPSTNSTAEPSLESRAAKGAVWSLVSFGGGQALRFVGNLILTRILLEEAFGLMALVNVFLIGLQLFSDVGVGPSIVQNERGDDPRFLDTAWTIQVGRGAALWLASCLGAAPFAAFYGDDRLATLLPVAGLTALIAGFNSTKLFTASRHLHLKALVMVEIGAQAASLATMVAWARFDRSVWALVAGGVANATTRMMLSHLLLPGARCRFTFDRDAARALMHFGRWIFLSTVLTFFVQQSDRLIFGKMIPIALLGVYSVAVMLATLPTTALGGLASQVLFPYLSRLHREGRRIEELFDRRREPLLVIAGWALSGLIAGGPVIVRLLYTDRWQSAGWIVQLIALAGWFGALEITNGSFLLARGDSRLVAASGAGKLLGMVALIPIGFHFGGFPGAVLGYVGAEFVRYGVSVWAVRSRGLRGLGLDLRLTLQGALAWAVGAWVALISDDWHKVLAAAGVFVAVSLAWSPTAASLWLRNRSKLARAA